MFLGSIRTPCNISGLFFPQPCSQADDNEICWAGAVLASMKQRGWRAICGYGMQSWTGSFSGPRIAIELNETANNQPSILVLYRQPYKEHLFHAQTYAREGLATPMPN